MTFSKTAEQCIKCEHFEDCDNKRMVMCAAKEYIPPEQYAEKASQDLTMPLAQEAMAKHDYRQIKIAPNTTITIDLEKEKKRIADEIYKALGCGFLNNGA